MITATLDDRPLPLNLDAARSLDEAAAMAAAAVVESTCDATPRERVVTVRWHDGRRASRRITA